MDIEKSLLLSVDIYFSYYYLPVFIYFEAENHAAHAPFFLHPCYQVEPMNRAAVSFSSVGDLITESLTDFYF